MRFLVGTLAIATAAMALGGCASRPKAQGPNDVLAVMDKELSHTVVNNDALDVMSDELSHAIGTTSLTSETLLTPMPLPEERMSLAEAAKPAPVTWGGSSQVDLSEIPDSRE